MTGRLQTPLEVKEINGGFVHNPARKPRGRPPKSKHPLGEPPKTFDQSECMIWAEIQVNVPEKVLTSADRFHIEIICQLMAKLRIRKARTADIGLLLKSLSACGMNPVDRQRLAPTEPWDTTESPFTKFKQ